MTRFVAMQAEYRQNPPPEFFLATFFRHRFGWEPPDDENQPRIEVELPEPLPVYE